MATDGPDPTPCDPKLFEDGTLMFVSHTIPSNAMEQWVQSVAKDCEQPVDWHFAGGRACVLALGDLDKVMASMRKLMPDHDERYKQALKKLGFGEDEHEPPRPDWW